MTERLKWMVAFSLFLAAIAYRPAHAAQDFWLQIAPPPPRLETTPVPRMNRVWSPGYWAWRYHHHTWVPGRWKESRAGYVWIPDHWMRDSNAWLFRHGHWEPEDVARS